MLSPVLLFLIDKCGPLYFGMSYTIYLFCVLSISLFLYPKNYFLFYLQTFMELHKYYMYVHVLCNVHVL